MARGRIHVGTSGWTYDDWAGRFYPEKVKGGDRLSYYAARFDTVEVNATFYRLPGEAMIRAWNRRLGPDFHLVLKASRVITHRKKLAGCEAEVETFLERALRLERLRAILWQLPPSFHKNISLLEEFLERLPEGVRHAFEFRHASWWDGEAAEVLSRKNAAFVAVSHPRLPPDVLPTADFLYARFHGLGPKACDYDYSPDELSEWAARLRPHLEGRDLYAFFNNDIDAQSVRNAEALRELLAGG